MFYVERIFSHLCGQEWRAEAVFTCLCVSICCLSKFYPPKRERERRLQRDERAPSRFVGLNLDCGFPSPISLWFSQSLTCNFPPANLFALSPPTLLHVSFSVSVNSKHFSDSDTNMDCCCVFIILWSHNGFLANPL